MNDFNSNSDPLKILQYKQCGTQAILNKIIKLLRKKNIERQPVFFDNQRNTSRLVFTSPYFKSMYLHQARNKLPSSKAVIRQVYTQSERCLLFDSLLLRLQNIHNEQIPVLCIPESSVDHVHDLYYNSNLLHMRGILELFWNLE